MKRRDALLNLAALAAVAGQPFGAGALAATSMRQGATLPAWVPAPGMRSNISLNVMADVDPCPRRNCIWSGGGQSRVVTAWSGAAFATHYGDLGAWIITGGGHGDYFGNEVYAFELDSRRWVRINDPYPGGRDSKVDYAEGEYAPGIPLSSHTYQHTQYLPPSLGGGSKGSLLLVVMYAAGRLAHGSGRSHACDLATGLWSRYSTNRASVNLNGTSSTAYDGQRRGYWRVPYGGRTLEFLSATDRTWKKETVGRRRRQSVRGRSRVCTRSGSRSAGRPRLGAFPRHRMGRRPQVAKAMARGQDYGRDVASVHAGNEHRMVSPAQVFRVLRGRASNVRSQALRRRRRTADRNLALGTGRAWRGGAGGPATRRAQELQPIPLGAWRSIASSGWTTIACRCRRGGCAEPDVHRLRVIAPGVPLATGLEPAGRPRNESRLVDASCSDVWTGPARATLAFSSCST